MTDISEFNTGTSFPGISCPKCRARISTYNQPKAAFFGCAECGTFFSATGGNKDSLMLFPAENKFTPAIPPGARAVIQEIEYTMVGFIQKVQADDDSIWWNEYAFFDPGQQWYVIFAEYAGHWMMVWHSENQDVELRESLGGVDRVVDAHKMLDLRLSYRFRIAYAEGAFDWNILDDERLITNEYVNPPAILISEDRDGIVEWFRACYMSPSAITDIMEVKLENFPERSSPYRFRPSTFYPAWKPLMVFTGVLLALFLGINGYLTLMKPSKTVCNTTFRCLPDSTTTGNYIAEVSGSFKIDGLAPVEIKMNSYDVDDNWLELPVALINDQDGKVYESDKTIEYYHGWEDGESWSEGSKEITTLFSGVPSGSYHLNFYPFSEYRSGDPFTPVVTVSVTQNVFLHLNFWLTLIAIITYPLIQLIRKLNYEHSKWFDSEYGNLTNE